MKTLAIELSTDTGSVAVLDDDVVQDQRQWIESRHERQRFFSVLSDMTRSGQRVLGSFEFFSVGIGPGAFAGLRMAVAAACGLAAPGRNTVVGVGSADATAFDLMNSRGVREVVIWGDARRNTLWAIRFRNDEGWPERQGGLMVGGMESLPNLFRSEGGVWATADWERIGGRLKALLPRGVDLVDTRVVPSASAVGRLAMRRVKLGMAGGAVLPVYVHPAVGAGTDEG